MTPTHSRRALPAGVAALSLLLAAGAARAGSPEEACAAALRPAAEAHPDWFTAATIANVRPRPVPGNPLAAYVLLDAGSADEPTVRPQTLQCYFAAQPGQAGQHALRTLMHDADSADGAGIGAALPRDVLAWDDAKQDRP